MREGRSYQYNNGKHIHHTLLYVPTLNLYGHCRRLAGSNIPVTRERNPYGNALHYKQDVVLSSHTNQKFQFGWSAKQTMCVFIGHWFTSKSIVQRPKGNHHDLEQVLPSTMQKMPQQSLALCTQYKQQTAWTRACYLAGMLQLLSLVYTDTLKTSL